MPQRMNERHNFMPINIPLVLRHGILSREEAPICRTISWRCPKFTSKWVPDGLKLHPYPPTSSSPEVEL